MSSRVLVARSKFLLLVSVLSTCVGLAAVSTGRSGPVDAEPQAGSAEAAVAISDIEPAASATVELPMPPPVEPTTGTATPPPAEPAAASNPEVVPPTEPVRLPAWR